MHESSLIKELIAKVEEVARDNSATRVQIVRVRLGPFAHCSPAHFREHFDEESKGTICDGARLEIIEDADAAFSDAISLESLEVE